MTATIQTELAKNTFKYWVAASVVSRKTDERPREAAFVQVGPWRLDRGLTFGRCEGTYENGAAATSALNRCPPPFAGARPVVTALVGGRRSKGHSTRQL